MTTAATFDIRENRLLAALTPAERELWRPLLEPVALDAGQVLHEAAHPPRYAWFPLSATASLLLAMEDGRCDEVAVVGREGIVGSSLFLGGGSSVLRAVVQRPGGAVRMRAESIQAECAGSAAVLRLLLRYTLALSADIAQGVVCSRHHSVEQRLCRRLLQSLDGCDDGGLAMTQEQLSGWLGVRRESVTVDALRLQRAGLIRYARGRITVLDRAGLEQRACGCFTLVKDEYRRLRAREPRLGPLLAVARADGPPALPLICEPDHAASRDPRGGAGARSCPAGRGPAR